MTYYNEDQLYRYFEKAIERESKKRAEKLQKEINYLYHKEMKKITEDLSMKKTLELNKKLKEVQIEYQEQLNQIGMGYDEQLIKERTRLSSSVFDQVIQKINVYTNSKPYIDQMIEKLQKITKAYPKDHLILYLGIHDEKLAKALEKEIKDTDKIDKTHEIKLGGFRILIENMQIEIDETIDQKFVEQQTWFYQHSKLFIR